VVGEALVVTADQRGVHRRFHAVRPVLREQDLEGSATQCAGSVA
jgi:hypothetical protein